jgi:hypothetical protein
MLQRQRHKAWYLLNHVFHKCAIWILQLLYEGQPLRPKIVHNLLHGSSLALALTLRLTLRLTDTGTDTNANTSIRALGR